MTTSLPRQDRIRRALELLRNETTDKFDDVLGFSAREFTDPVLAQQERDLIFGRVPSIVAHGSEIARPYDFMTVQMPRNNLIVVRQKDNSVKAFVNLCRHRGALLEDSEKGRCRFFSCPYHRWSYDPDGSLRMVTRDATFGEIDRKKQGLVEVPCEERHGFIWVVDNAHASIDVASLAGAGYGYDPGRLSPRRAPVLPVGGVRRTDQLEDHAGCVPRRLPHPVRPPQHRRQDHPHQCHGIRGFRSALPVHRTAQVDRPLAGGRPGRPPTGSLCHRDTLPAA